MQNTKKTKAFSFKRLCKKACVSILVAAMMLQTLAIPGLAFEDVLSSLLGNAQNQQSANGIGKFESDELTAQLKKDLIKYINQDLIQSIEDYELSGAVGAIISFSENSLISTFTSSDAANRMTFAEYRESSEALTLIERLSANRAGVLASLQEEGLITGVKFNYYNIMDGAYVSTTYENIEAICNYAGVERVIISNTYEAAVAVENPVYVYDTGIFNSSNISYTGKGTIVAVLDTGCDYTHSAFTTHQVQSPLYSREDIAGMLPDTLAYSYDTSLEVREVYYGNITGNKIAFGYDYADRDPDIMPASSGHGTHVAGIIAGKDSTITGVAIDAQLAIMKVFSDSKQGAEDGDILAALEDSVTLGVDAINMSLGSSCGFSREVDEEYKNELYDSIEAAGISLVVAASNDHSSGYGNERGNTNKTDNPDSATVGAPSTYSSAMAVASISGSKDKYMLANGEREVFFHQSVNQSAKEYDFFEMLGITADNPRVEYEYVTVPGVGMAINYSGLDVEGKIALVRRGDITFEEKIQYATEAGAIAVIIYNNVFGDIMMTVGNHIKIPAVSIGKDDGDVLAAQETGTIVFDFNNEAGPFMSDFSSWGPTPDLKLKPEITAHGGNILSSIPGGGYEEQSGTSMAAPNMCGITVLIRQYVKEKYPNMSATEVRDMVNQLCMSTATIALDKVGNPYSPRKQGAGIADIEKATQTLAYLYVDGLNKTKLELGDDPRREGVYTMKINLKNISDQAVSYRLGNITMTESVSTSEPEYVAEMAYLLSNAAEYSVENGVYADGIVTVAAGQTAAITVTLTLSSADKAYINTNFANGMYVEGYLTFDNTADGGIDLNAPFLAFFGDWGEAPIFDLDYYEEETEAHNNAIDEDDKIKADYYPTTPLGTYYYDYLMPLGAYVFKVDENAYSPIPATRERAAISYYKDCISGIYGVFTGLLRGAKEMTITIVNTATGETVWSETQYNCYKAHFSGQPYPYISHLDIPMVDLDENEVFGENNAHFEVTMSAKLDWDGETRNSNDTYSFSFYVDYEAPTVTDAQFRTEYDKSREENRYYVDLYVYDNHYAMAVRPVLVFDYVESDGEVKKSYTDLGELPIPVYQENRGEVTKVTMEITDYMDIIMNSEQPDGISVYINDYALNGNCCFIPFPETENDEMEFMESALTLDINQTFDLTKYLVYKDTTDPVVSDYLASLTWESSDESVVAIYNGKIEALKTGQATIRVTGSSWFADDEGKIPLYKTIVINVSDQVADDPLSAANVQIEKLEFSSYHTLFAFNSDIDYSEIGLTDSTHYFGGNYSLAMYPSEQVQLNYSLEPWNLSKDRYTLKWTSSNPKVATVDENGVVTAQEEGNARITLQITIDGKTSLLAARCAFEVKSEFIIENRTLVAYKGKGGDVVIPDDEGIMIIGKYAFCHFEIDNEMEVEKDEDGYYDIDLKKTPLSNKTVTSVVIPEGVEIIEKFAFSNCDKLKTVTLPESCKTINHYAFQGCDLLTDVNFDYVTVIGTGAFSQCKSLTCEDLGGANLKGVYNIGANAFYNTRLSSVVLTNLGRCGTAAFANCSQLVSVQLGQKTRIAERMFENTALKTVTVYSDMIGDKAFHGCQDLTAVTLESDMTYLGANAFDGCTSLSSVTFKGGCEQIGDSAFTGCTSLRNFVLPNGGVELGDLVFVGSGLQKLTFSKNTDLQGCGISMFQNLRSVTVDASASELYYLENDALYTKDGTRLVLLIPTSSIFTFTVPASVKTIASGAFSGCDAFLTTVRFAQGSLLENIEYAAFANCFSLQTVELPDRELALGDLAFFNAKYLNSINLENVTSVGSSAFENCVQLTEINLTHSNVEIGMAAFAGCSKLATVKLGAAAVVGDYVFYGAGVKKVEFLGADATVGMGAFAYCQQLSSFDFADVSGKLGDFAFMNCVSLTAVDIPAIVEIGETCFANCYNITSFRAENLEILGATAFAPDANSTHGGAAFTSFYAPKLQKIGDGAFYKCAKLQSIDLSNVTEIGINAFGYCSALTTVMMPERLEYLSNGAFFECAALENIDLGGIIKFGQGSLYGTKLPAHLELTNAEVLEEYAFTENEVHTIESVNAPNLKEIGEMAFAGCEKLTTVYAPKLESIAYGAFINTAIEEFEIFESLRDVEYALFEGNEKMAAFFTKVNGEKVYDCVYENVMIKDGALYTVASTGYILSSYPVAKTAETLEVAEGTVRIELGAALNNKHLKTVILPGTLKYIGNIAFMGCDSLEKVQFKSYYAPTLEGTWSGSMEEITPENMADFVALDKLSKYDYFLKFENKISLRYTYMNFVGDVAKSEGTLTYVIPQNSKGYDTIIYTTYFKPSETEDSGVVMGPYAIAFVEAVAKLPETADRFDKAVVEAAINAYNALNNRADEKAFVAQSLIDKFQKARSEYNVDVVTNLINHLFSMDNCKHSFDTLKAARAAYLALTDAERAAVTNASVIDAKIAELTASMGREIDFNLTYEEHFPETEQPPVEEPNGGEEPVPPKTDVWVIVLIVSLSVLAAAAIAVGVVLFIKKKKRE